MTGAEIRKARKERGWTQQELAQQVGCTQPVISQIEREEDAGYDRIFARVRRLFQSDDAFTERTPEFRLPEIPLKPPHAVLPVELQRWHRPAYSGDFALALPVPQKAILLAALDVSGNGVSVYPTAMYLQGWLRAWADMQSKIPRLESLVSDLSAELWQTGIDATGFFALITGSSDGFHEVYYQGIACGFPAPLLLVGDSGRALDSCVEWPSLPWDGGTPPSPMRLSAPWRLVAATDDLLERLGGGEQKGGLQWLRRWQTGPKRDRPFGEVLSSDSAPAVDELLIAVTWDGWDKEVPVNACDYEERTRIRREIVACIEDRPDAVPMYSQALMEAMCNVAKHAYPEGNGRIRVRFRVENDAYRTEIEDEGKNKVGRKDFNREDGGFEIMRRSTDHVSVRQGAAGGTIVTLVLNRPNNKPAQRN